MTSEQDKKLQALDLKIAKALQIDVPELRMPELPDIDETNVTSLQGHRRSMKPLWFAIAATVVLATSISLRTSSLFQTYESLAEEVLAHLDHEPGSLRITDVAVTEQRLARVVPASLASFERGTSLITYAQSCVINGNEVPHLVIQGQYGPVTILLMPEERVSESTPLDGETVKGVILPVGNGSIAIIGDREEPLEPIQKNVVNSVAWTT
jgi:hypothetical protein